MDTITNISAVTDNSGELPVTTVSNPVTTVVNTPEPPECDYCYCCCCCRCCRCCCEYYRTCCCGCRYRCGKNNCG